MKRQELRNALIGKRLRWSMEDYICTIEQLDFTEYACDKTIGLYLRDTNYYKQSNYRRFFKRDLENLIHTGEQDGYILLDQPTEKRQLIKAIIDRTTKDITALKGLFSNPAIAEMIDEAAKEWLITLRAIHTYFKSKDEL